MRRPPIPINRHFVTWPKRTASRSPGLSGEGAPVFVLGMSGTVGSRGAAFFRWGVVVSDGPFVRDMRTHPDPAVAGMLVPLDAWARSKGIAS